MKKLDPNGYNEYGFDNIAISVAEYCGGVNGQMSQDEVEEALIAGHVGEWVLDELGHDLVDKLGQDGVTKVLHLVARAMIRQERAWETEEST